MDNKLLEKQKNDPAWAEVIRLYSGLFDTQDEREEFILDLAETDILLAAECKTSSVEDEKNLTQFIINVAYELNHDENYDSIYSLLELQRYDMAFDILRAKSSLANSSTFFNKVLYYIKHASEFYQLMQVFIENKKIRSYFVKFLNVGKMEQSFDIDKNEINSFLNFLNNLIEHNLNPSFIFFSFNVPLTKKTLPILINIITYLKILGISERAGQLINKYSINLENFNFLISTDNNFIDLFLSEVEEQHLKINIDELKSLIEASLKSNLFFNFKKIVQKKLQINDREFIGLVNSIKFKAIVERHTEYGIQVKLIKFRKTFGLLKKHLIIERNANKRMYPGQLIDVRIIDFHTKQKSTLIFSMKDFEEKNRVYIIQDSFEEKNFMKLSIIVKNRFIIGKEYSWDILYSELEKYTGKSLKNRIWDNIIQNYLFYLSHFKIVTVIDNTIIFNQISDNLFLLNSINIVINNVIVCEITKITPSRVFVKIEKETRPASIYMGELTNQRLANINDFEYNGMKIHIGQKLIAKVIRIDEKIGIQLSLKGVK